MEFVIFITKDMKSENDFENYFFTIRATAPIGQYVHCLPLSTQYTQN